MTDYNLGTLGPREFEHMIQALALKELGSNLVVFGDGPDGGREASWTYAGSRGSARGKKYGVLQAKYHIRESTPSHNLTWIKGQIKTELNEWKDSKRRGRTPDKLLVATNVHLSSVPNAGKDRALKYTKELIRELKLRVNEIVIWDYDQIRVRLDNAIDIRSRYAAFISSSELISELLNEITSDKSNFSHAIQLSTKFSLKEDASLNLTQAGMMSEHNATVSDVFVDLPCTFPNELPEGLKSEGISSTRTQLQARNRIHNGDPSAFNATSTLIANLNRSLEPGGPGEKNAPRVLLIGGPGQGKSTVSQWLAQQYRVSFLEAIDKVGSEDKILKHVQQIKDRASFLSLPSICAHRWPFRIVLTELADYMAKNEDHSILSYMVEKISRQTATRLEIAQLRRWAKEYPWLLLIDGLDEVPTSSNRELVLQAISEMSIEFDSLGADVAIIATTRPQGYHNELEHYNEIELRKLSKEVALEYAKSLVNIRFGASSAKAIQVMERIERAAVEQTTKKLFDTPLQVTILTVLLEKLGRAPRDRSRLFSQYYDVISSREQEKSGELSELLQAYESDIRSLHRKIGFELQREAADTGGTSATISKTEFREYIGRQFESQGHSKLEIENLLEDFSRLVTDRLVFLSFSSHERIGFELRSFQEYMAGEYLTALPEQEVVRSLEAYVASEYWRNVVIFAIGRIFADRDHLRAEIVTMCQRLNCGSVQSLVLLGSDLALDILLDGSCVSMPRYSVPLAMTASEMLDGPINSRCLKLFDLDDSRLVEQVVSKFQKVGDLRSFGWVNRSMALAASGQDDKTWYWDFIEQFAPSKAKRAIAKYAWSNCRALNSWDYVFDRFFRFVAPQDLSPLGAVPKARLESIRHLSALVSSSGGRSNRNTESSGVYFSANSLGSNVDAWAWLRSALPSNEQCSVTVSVADFVLNPNGHTLAQVLRCISNAEEFYVPSFSPWVILSEFELALSSYQSLESLDEDDASIREHLLHRADLAERGRLGTLDSWLESERNYDLYVKLGNEFIKSLSCESSGEDTPSVLRAYNAVFTTVQNSDNTQTVPDLIACITGVEFSDIVNSEYPQFVSVASFAFSVLSSRPDLEAAISCRDRDGIVKWMSLCSSISLGRNFVWLDWFRFIGDNYLQDSVLLKVLGDLYGAAVRDVLPNSSRLSASIIDSGPQDWRLIRLALILDGSAFWNSDAVESFKEKVLATDDYISNNFVIALKILAYPARNLNLLSSLVRQIDEPKIRSVWRSEGGWMRRVLMDQSCDLSFFAHVVRVFQQFDLGIESILIKSIRTRFSDSWVEQEEG